ncbi:hypothetical protein ACF0H5_022820 [Mactra antiquata]
MNFIPVFMILVLASSCQLSDAVCPTQQGMMGGGCVFDPAINCLSDADCSGGQECCPSGCNKICI